MFIAAGKINYPQGWIYFAISVFGLMINIITTKSNSELIAERSSPGSSIQSWDKKILGLSAIVTILSYIVAGLDSGRFNWSGYFDLKITILGALLVITGQIIFTTAKYQNNFFSSVVRIQKERSHTVCNRGLYKYIRHPGYSGMMLSWIGFPLVLNSAYSAIPVLLGIILLIVRTRLEDIFLSSELTGYREYMKTTKCKILPFIW